MHLHSHLYNHDSSASIQAKMKDLNDVFFLMFKRQLD